MPVIRKQSLDPFTAHQPTSSSIGPGSTIAAGRTARSAAATGLLVGAALCLSATAAAQNRPIADLRGHTGDVGSLDFDPEGKLLASSGDGGVISVWDVAGARRVRTIEPKRQVEDLGTARFSTSRKSEWVAFSPDGKLIAEAATEPSQDGTIRLWNTETGGLVRMLANDARNARAIAFSPDGKRLAAAMRDGRRPTHKIVLYDVETGSPEAELRDQRLSATLLAFTPDGKHLLSAGGTTIHVWDMADRSVRHVMSRAHSKAIQSLAAAPDSATFATGGSDDEINIWSVESGQETEDIEAEQDGVFALVYSPDGKLLVSGGGDHTIRLWSPESGQSKDRLWAHVERVLALAISPDGKRLASGSADDTISLWNFEAIAAEAMD